MSFDIQGLHVLASFLSDFVMWVVRLGEGIFYSGDSDIQIHLTYSRCHIFLLSFAFISFLIIVIPLIYGHSKLAIEFD
jgi:hypothetical protein